MVHESFASGRTEFSEGGIKEVLDNSEEEDDDEWNDLSWTEHDRLARDLYVEVPYFLDVYDPSEASDLVANALLEGSGVKSKLLSLFENARSTECRELIAEHFGYFMAALGREEDMPFVGWELENTCPDFDEMPDYVGINAQNTTEGTSKGSDGAEYIDDPADLRILYGLLIHDDPLSTIRLIESLYEPGHTFVIHVDAKEKSQSTYRTISEYATSAEHVHVLAYPYRSRITWGGFSMVNATLHMLKYSFGLLPDQNDEALDFHKVVLLSGTTYPIASNMKIRLEISKSPLNTNFLQIVEMPREYQCFRQDPT